MVTLIHQQLSKSAAVLDLGLWVRTTRDRVVFGFAPAAVVESLYGLYEAAARAQNYGIEVDRMVPFSHGETPIFPSPVAGVTRPRRTAEFTALPRNNEGAMKSDESDVYLSGAWQSRRVPSCSSETPGEYRRVKPNPVSKLFCAPTLPQ
jgi:hypothetical protein